MPQLATLLFALVLTAAEPAAEGIEGFILPPYLPVPARCPQLALAGAALDARDADEALRQLRHAGGDFAYFPPARLMLARMLFARGQVAAARSVLENAALESPQHPEVYFLFAQIGLAEGRLTEALALLEKAATLEMPKAWSEEIRTRFAGQLAAGRASIAERRRNWPAAQQELLAWIKLMPNSGIARQRLAVAYFHGESRETNQKNERDVKVLKLLLQATELDPSLEPAETTLAWLYSSTGDDKRAGELLKEAATRHAGNARAQFRYGAWLLGQGATRDAKLHLEKAAELGLETREFQITRGLALRQTENYPEAEILFEEIYRESPGEFEPANQLALALAEQSAPEKRERALRMAEATARQFPNAAEALATLGWIHYLQGRLGQAEQLLRASSGGGALRSDSAYFLARVLMEKGPSDDASKAVETLRRAVQKTGQFVYRDRAQEWLNSLEGGGSQGTKGAKKPSASDLDFTPPEGEGK